MKQIHEQKEQVESEYKEKIIGILTVLFPKAKIYIFGSRARGTASEISDIDLAIDENKKIRPINKIAEARDMLNASNIPYQIDIVDFQSISSSMQEQILKEGILWRI